MRRRIQSLESPHDLFVTDITFSEKKFQVRLNREERASGTSDDNSELDNLLEEILEKEKAAKEKLDNDDESLANEKAAAEDMRKHALERVGQTAKRKSKEEGPEAEKSKSRKSRKSTGEAVEYLKERASKEIQLREQELEMRKKEQDSISQREREKNEQQDKMLSTMLKQHEQQQQTIMMLLNQQQQQSQALLSLFQSKTQLFLFFSLWIHSRSVLS